MNKSLYKLLIILIKYIPAIVTLMYVIYYACCIFGYNVEWLKDISKISLVPLIYFYCCSIAFNFCWRHRLCLHYVLFSDITTMYIRTTDDISNQFWFIIKIILGVLCIGILIGNNTSYGNRCSKLF